MNALKNYILDCDISEAQKKMEHQLEIMKKYPYRPRYIFAGVGEIVNNNPIIL